MEGIVPGGDDESAAVGFELDAIAAREEVEGAACPTRSKPAFERFADEPGFFEEEIVFGEKGFDGGFAEIVGEGGEHGLLVLFENLLESTEGLQAGFDVASFPGGKEFALLLEQVGNVFQARLVHLVTSYGGSVD